MFFGKAVEPWRIDEIEANNSRHESNSHQGSKPTPIGLSGKTNHGIAAVLCGIKSKKKYKHAHPSSCQVEVTHGIFFPGKSSHKPNSNEGKKIKTHKDYATGIE